MEYAIQTDKLHKVFRQEKGLSDLFKSGNANEKVAVNSLTLQIREGEIFGLLGPNGSGKTTFLKMLGTILLPTSGSATIFGHDIVREENKVRKIVGLVTGEERSLYWRLTGRQNLYFFGNLYGIKRQGMESQINKLLKLFDLEHAADNRVSGYSSGMKQKLAIARGLLGNPKILFLDEPTRTLDPLAAHNLLNLISITNVNCKMQYGLGIKSIFESAFS